MGTVRDLVNDAGTLQNHKTYDAFGNVAAETNGAVDTVFGYTGKLFDDATGLQNNWHRWYDAKVGRWISEDWIRDDVGNSYRYVANAATAFIDIDGLASQWHHLLPQKFIDQFKDAGFDVHSSTYGWIIDEEYHEVKGKGNRLHPAWNQCWKNFFDNNKKPSKRAIEDQLDRMKRQFSHILRNGRRATLSYSEWGKWQRRLREAAKRAAKTKGTVRVRIPKSLTSLGKAAKVVPIVTFAYQASTNSVAVAAEGCVEDALWPFLDIARESTEPFNAMLREAVRGGKLNRARRSDWMERLLEDPVGTHIPGTPRP